jgi:predicted nucleic acid-binding protein
MTAEIIIDASVLVALFDETDVWHRQSFELLSACELRHIGVVVLDSVINETMSVLIRRFHNKRKVDKLKECFNKIIAFVPPEKLRPTSSLILKNYYEILDIIAKSNYQFGFNDAVIVSFVQENSIARLLSFDSDFDSIPTIQRISSVEQF